MSYSFDDTHEMAAMDISTWDIMINLEMKLDHFFMFNSFFLNSMKC